MERWVAMAAMRDAKGQGIDREECPDNRVIGSRPRHRQDRLAA